MEDNRVNYHARPSKGHSSYGDVGSATLDLSEPTDFEFYHQKEVVRNPYGKIVVCKLDGGELDIDPNCEDRKTYWTLNQSGTMGLVLFGEEASQFNYPSEISATMVQDIYFVNFFENRKHSLRGVYSPKYRRKILFSDSIRLDNAKLKRWKPKAIIGGRNFSDDDNH